MGERSLPILRLQVHDYRTEQDVLVEKGGTYAYEANKSIGVRAECDARGYSDARLKIIVKDTAGITIFNWQGANLAGYSAIFDGATFTVPDRSVIVYFELYGDGVKVDATTLTIVVTAPPPPPPPPPPPYPSCPMWMNTLHAFAVKYGLKRLQQGLETLAENKKCSLT